jgi:hypothetical protein
MIFDVGTGLFFLSVLLLAAGCGGRRLYLLTLPAIVLLAIVQRGGCLPDEKNLQTETPPPPLPLKRRMQVKAKTNRNINRKLYDL